MCKSDAPDTTLQQQAALKAAQTGEEALQWFMAKDAEAKPMRDAAAKTALEVAQQQLASSKTQDGIAADYANYNKTTFRPLEQKIVGDAQAYDTPEKRQAAADAALADVNMGFAKSNEATARTLAANGVNPASTRAMSVMEGQAVDQATSGAAAAYRARKGVETTGHAMEMDAASLGRNLPSAQTTSAQLALNAGAGAVGASGAPVTQANQGAATYGAGFGTAINGQQVAGNLYGQVANEQAAANATDSGLFGALGTIGGAAISKWSDETLKTDIAPMSDEEALAATAATPVSKFKYDPAKMAARGIPMEPDMQGEQIGPMAQDVNASMGDEAAPGGKKINLVTMNGVNMKAIQAVNKKVDGLQQQVSSLAAMIRGGKVQAGVAA